MKHIVQFSGGVGSWAAAKLVAERHVDGVLNSMENIELLQRISDVMGSDDASIDNDPLWLGKLFL